MIIIFGASGFIGSYLFQFYSKNYGGVIGTYYKSRLNDLIYFDVRNSNITDVPLSGIKYAIICSAESTIDRIKNEPSHCYDLNVTAPIRLIEELEKRNIMPIYISSDYVFDGIKGNYEENDERLPQTIYGQQKKEVEDFILENIKDHLIIRISKIHSHEKVQKNWLWVWGDKLKKGEKLKCAIDQIFSPTHINDVVVGIDLLIKKKLTGIYHIANSEIYSKYEIGLKICDFFKFRKDLISSVKINEIGLLEKRPLNTSLNSKKFLKRTGRGFGSIDYDIKQLVDQADSEEKRG